MHCSWVFHQILESRAPFVGITNIQPCSLRFHWAVIHCPKQLNDGFTRSLTTNFCSHVLLALLSALLLNEVHLCFAEVVRYTETIDLMTSKQDGSLRGIRVQLYILGKNDLLNDIQGLPSTDPVTDKTSEKACFDAPKQSPGRASSHTSTPCLPPSKKSKKDGFLSMLGS